MDVVLLGVVGSTAHGLSHAGSDVDRLGVFQASTAEVLGLNSFSVQTKTVSGHNPDFTVYELSRFVSLAVKANPTALELLFLPDWEVCSKVGSKLVESRQSFLATRTVRAAYAGYATSQARQAASFKDKASTLSSQDLAKRTAKSARHCFRALHVGYQLLTTGNCLVDVSDVSHEITQAGVLACDNPSEFTRLFESRLTKLDTAVSVLPDEPDLALVNTLLVGARRHQL